MGACGSKADVATPSNIPEPKKPELAKAASNGRASPIPPRPAQTTTVVPTAVAKVEAVILSEESEENLPTVEAVISKTQPGMLPVAGTPPAALEQNVPAMAPSAPPPAMPPAALLAKPPAPAPAASPAPAPAAAATTTATEAAVTATVVAAAAVTAAVAAAPTSSAAPASAPAYPETKGEPVEAEIKPTAAEGVIPYPICPDGVQSLRQKALAPELVAAWEKEANFGNPLTEEQQGKFPQFRSLLLAEGILHEMYDNKPSMFRFLQARQWDLEKAATMYRNHMEWRKREELDTWLPTPSGPMPKLLIEFYFPEIAEVKRYYPFCYHKMTKEGRPIYFDRLGAIEYKNMIKNSSPERVLKYFTWFAEASQQYRNPAASLVCGKHIGKSHFIIDMKGFGISKLNSETRKFISDFSKIASDNYPECMHKTWIINAPFIFQTAWAMVKNMLDPQTVAKFSIMGGERDYMPKLLQLMDKKDIPTFCGGADDTYDPCKEIGPWAELMPSSQGPLH